MAGRPPKPTGLHIIEGTYQKSRHGRRPRLKADGIGTAPEYLSAEARSAWDEMIAALPFLCRADRPAAIHRAALEGKLVATLSGKLKGRARISLKEQQLLHSLRMQFGATPASQAKVRMPETGQKENRFAALGSA